MSTLATLADAALALSTSKPAPTPTGATPAAAASLIGLLPIGASIVVAARTLLGVRSVGVFAPVLIALAVIELGARTGIVAIALSVTAGLAAAPLLDRLALPRVARLALLLVVVCVAIQWTGVVDASAALVPVIVLTVLVERTWDVAQHEGLPGALRLGATTLLLSAAVGLVVGLPALRELGERHWALTAAFGAALILAAGSYRGLRLPERRRFAHLRRDEVAA